MDDGANLTLDDELADEAFLSVFPNGVPSARPSAATPIMSAFPLTAEHLAKLQVHADSGQALGVTHQLRARMSRVHHRAAQLLANGVHPGKVALLCGMGAASISILQSDPMFGELLEYYSSMVEDEFRSVAEEMADLNADVIGELRHRLDNMPETFTTTQLLEAMKALSDRTGHGPTSNHNVRAVTVALSGTELARIKTGPGSAPGVPRSPVPLPPGATQSLQGLLDFPSVVNAATVSATGLGEESGLRVGAEGEGPPQDGLSDPPVPIPRVD